MSRSGWAIGASAALMAGLLSQVAFVPAAASAPFGIAATGALTASQAAGDGTAITWGVGFSGALGDGNAWKTVPVAVDTSGVLAGKTITAVATGGNHTCAVAGGKAYCWGSGALGSDTTTGSTVPVAVDTSGVLAGKTVTSVAAGGSHTCAVADGKAYCWGSGYYGQLGAMNTISGSTVPVAVDTSGVLAGKTVTSVAAGENHTCAVADGKAYCWGSGALGNDTITDSTVPVPVDTSGVLAGKTVTSVAAGENHTCAVADGNATCWGSGYYGQLGHAATSDMQLPVAVDASGVLAGKTVTSVAAGGNTSCAVAGGKAFCWGRGDSGQLGNNTATGSTVPVAVDTNGVLAGKTVSSVTVGENHTCAVADGQAYCWGRGDSGQLGNNTATGSTVPVAVDTSGVLAGRTVTSVATGGNATCSVADGQAYCWGSGDNGKLGNGGSSTASLPVRVDASGVLAGRTVTSVAAGNSHTCAVAGGRAYCWGSGDSGQLGNNTATGSTVPVAVDTNGVLAGKTVTSVAAGGNTSCAVAGGKAFCWGRGDYGQLGNNAATGSTVPVAVDTNGVLAGKTVTSVAAGENHTCAVADGKAYCWGRGDYGQLGNNTATGSTVPVAVDTSGVLAGRTVTSVATGGNHTCAVADGKAYCWGSNYHGQVGINNFTQSKVPVAVTTSGVLAGKTVASVAGGGDTSCAVADGKAYCWGRGDYGQLGNNKTADSTIPVAVDTNGVLAGKTITSVATGGNHTCAVADGNAYCWGLGIDGRLGNNITNRVTFSTPVAVDTSGVLAGKTITSVATGGGHTAGAVSGSAGPVSVPGAPTGVSGMPGDAQVSLSWVAPTDDGGSPVLGYEVVASPSGSTCTTDGPTACTVSGLTNGQAYEFTVRARNDQGWSQPSTPSPAITPVSVPGAPTGVSGMPGDAQVSLSWVAPTDDGGSPVLGYEVVASPSGSTCTTDGPTACTVSGLTNGQAYEFTVRARNDQGWSQPSTPSPAITPRVTPPSPTASPNPTVTPPTGAGTKAPGKVQQALVKVRFAKGKVTITWKHAARADSYRVRISKPSGSKYTKWRQTTKRKYVFKTRLSGSKEYRVQIRPFGAGGEGPVTTVKFAPR